MDTLTEKICRQIMLLIWNSFIGQIFFPAGGEEWGKENLFMVPIKLG